MHMANSAAINDGSRILASTSMSDICFGERTLLCMLRRMAGAAKAINQIADSPSAVRPQVFLKTRPPPLPSPPRCISIVPFFLLPIFPRGRGRTTSRGDGGGEHYRRVCSANNGRFFLSPRSSPPPGGRGRRGSQSPSETDTQVFPRLSGANRYEPRDLAPVSWSRRVCGRVGARRFFRSPDPTHCRDKTVGRELSTTRMSWLVASSLAAAAAVVGRLEAPGAMEGPKSVNIQQVVTTERRGSRDRHVDRPKSAIRSCRRFSYAS